MKRFCIFVALLVAALLSSSTMLWAAEPAPILPKAFGGWQKTESKTSTDPAEADAANAPLMKEYGFTDFESATYTRPDRKMTVKAARFTDTSGAYGAFTFYKLPEMLSEKFGDQGASANERILFYRGNVLVQAMLDRVTAMSAAELRELSTAIPLPRGPSRNLPTLPQYLPKQAYVKNSAKYVLGPVGLNAIGAPLTAEQVDFNKGAEVAEGRYLTSNGEATLLLISYPTPQIAGERQRAFEALNQNPPPSQNPTLAAPFTVKRTGPMVVLVAGQISSGEAKSLLASINYEADVTWNENTSFDKRNNVANLLVNIIFLIFILIGFALIIGVAFGGIRILLSRLYPGRGFGRSDDMDIIQLRLHR